MNVSLETEQAENQLLRDEIKQERVGCSLHIDSFCFLKLFELAVKGGINEYVQ